MDNKMIVRRFYEEIVNTGDVSRIAEVVSDDYTEVMDGNRYPVGPEGAASHGKLPRQVERVEVDSWGAVGLGRKASGGTRPRLSWGRSVL